MRMKKFIVCMFLFFTAFSLHAQTAKPAVPHTAAVYVLPVTGTGSAPEDNAFFYNKLVSEITFQNYILAQTLNESEYYYIGTLSANPELSDKGVKQYIFQLTIFDTKTNEIQAEGNVVYVDPEEVGDMFSSLVYTLLLTIPETAGKNNWRNKQIYVSASAFWTPRAYASEESSAMNVINFGGGIYIEWHFLNFLAAEMGFEYATDVLKVSAQSADNYTNPMLEIPVMIKHVIKPSDHFLLMPYTGVHLNFPFTRNTVPPAFSWFIGFEYGVKLGPGVFYIDPRIAIDLGESRMDPVSEFKDVTFQRYIIHIGAGYKYGFFTRR